MEISVNRHPDTESPSEAAVLKRFRPYRAYKDSAVDWFRRIPQHWEVRRLKTIADVRLSNVDKKSEEGQEAVLLCNYVDVYYNERITSDMAFMPATATHGQIDRFGLRRGDVLITKDSESWDDIAIPSVVAEELDNVLCGYHLALIRPGEKVHGPYLARAFGASGVRDQFRVSANGITRFGIGSDAIGSALFMLPPPEDQQAIAAFLDRETAQIDALVSKKERLIELLQEKRSAVITNAVTKGIDHNVPMRDSGVEWLGRIPAGWKLRRLKEIAVRIEQGWSPLCENRQAEPDEWGVLKVGCVNGDNFDETEQKALPSDISPRVEYEIHEGDILISRANTRQLLGSAALVRTVRPRLLLCDKLYRIQVASEVVTPEFITRALRSASARFQFEREATGASGSMQNISQEMIANLVLPLPTIKEQRAILNVVDDVTTLFRALEKQVAAAVEVLGALRTALISAAVTGKIDVREDVA